MSSPVAPTPRAQRPWTYECPGQQLIDDWANGLGSEEEAEDEKEKRSETESKEEKRTEVFSLKKESKDVRRKTQS